MIRVWFLLLATLLGMTPAQAANVASGAVWVSPGGSPPRALPENIPATPPDVVFRAPASPLVLDSRASGAPRLGDVLAGAGAYGIVENRAGTLESSAGGRFYVFTGQVTVRRGQTFTALHADNLTLIIGGIPVMSVSGQAASTVTATTYGGQSGTMPFTLILAQCCDGEGSLNIDLPLRLLTMIPAPSGAALLALGLAAMLLVRTRRAG